MTHYRRFRERTARYSVTAFIHYSASPGFNFPQEGTASALSVTTANFWGRYSVCPRKATTPAPKGRSPPVKRWHHRRELNPVTGIWSSSRLQASQWRKLNCSVPNQNRLSGPFPRNSFRVHHTPSSCKLVAVARVELDPKLMRLLC